MVHADDDSTLFPQKLMSILADPMNQDAISWLPDGQAFVIRDREMFAETVMPKYFSRKAKFSSFTRKLNRWNFMRVANGPEYGAYFHKFFLRDQPHLAAQMFCKNARTMFAMASDVTEKKTDAVALLQVDFAEPILARSSIDQMSSALLQTGSIPYLGGMSKMRDSTPSAPMSFPSAMLLQSEKERLSDMILDRALKMRQQFSALPMQSQTPQDRLLHVRRLMEVSMQHQHLYQQRKELHHPLMHQGRNDDGRVPNIKRASAA